MIISRFFLLSLLFIHPAHFILLIILKLKGIYRCKLIYLVLLLHICKQWLNRCLGLHGLFRLIFQLVNALQYNICRFSVSKSRFIDNSIFIFFVLLIDLWLWNRPFFFNFHWLFHTLFFSTDTTHLKVQSLNINL